MIRASGRQWQTATACLFHRLACLGRGAGFLFDQGAGWAADIKLQHIQPGDEIILRPKPVGTLVHDALMPGKRLWFLATGTGIAPFADLMREPSI